MKRRIVIADPYTSIRDMMEAVLSRNCAYEIIGKAASGHDAISICLSQRPDLLILDLPLSKLSGIEVMRRLKAERVAPRLLVYAETICVNAIRDVLNCRPEGFVQKSEGLDVLLEGIKAVLAGCRYFTPLASALFDESRVKHSVSIGLTRREREVIQMIAEGHSSKEIANCLEIKAKTVENHRQNLMDKLHVHSIAGLTRYALKEGLLKAD